MSHGFDRLCPALLPLPARHGPAQLPERDKADRGHMRPQQPAQRGTDIVQFAVQPRQPQMSRSGTQRRLGLLGAFLRKDTAAAWNTLCLYAWTRYGVRLYAPTPRTFYRTIEEPLRSALADGSRWK